MRPHPECRAGRCMRVRSGCSALRCGCSGAGGAGWRRGDRTKLPQETRGVKDDGRWRSRPCRDRQCSGFRGAVATVCAVAAGCAGRRPQFEVIARQVDARPPAEAHRVEQRLRDRSRPTLSMIAVSSARSSACSTSVLVRPSRMATERSIASATSLSCVTMMVVRPSSAFSPRSRPSTSRAVTLSSSPVGSSASSSGGSFASATASAPRCCSPPESRSGR